MVSAVGSGAPPPGVAQSGPRAPNLDAQLARAQSQLADWVNCPSCKTAAGQAKIAEINAQIGAIKSSMQRAENARPAHAAAAPAPGRAVAPAAGVEAPSGAQVGAAAKSLAKLGGLIDVYA